MTPALSPSSQSSDSFEESRLLLATPEPDDINQEAAILQWIQKNKRANRQVIQRRLSSQHGSFWLYASEADLPAGSRQLWRADESDEDALTAAVNVEEHFRTIRDQLVSWSNTQSKSVQALIRQFLEQETPDQEEIYPRIIRILRRRGLLAQPPQLKSSDERIKTKPATSARTGGKITLIQILYQAIRQQPQTLDSLYRLTSSVHPARRPEAACRQALRRLMRQNLIQKTLEETYQAIGGND